METTLAEMGEHQLTIRDYLRHSTLHITNKYLQPTTETKRPAQGKLVEAICRIRATNRNIRGSETHAGLAYLNQTHQIGFLDFLYAL